MIEFSSIPGPNKASLLPETNLITQSVQLNVVVKLLDAFPFSMGIERIRIPVSDEHKPASACLSTYVFSAPRHLQPEVLAGFVPLSLTKPGSSTGNGTQNCHRHRAWKFSNLLITTSTFQSTWVQKGQLYFCSLYTKRYCKIIII